MIEVSVEVREGAAPFRLTVRGATITRAVSAIEERHPGRDVRVVFPIDPEEFFVADPKETSAAQDEKRRPRPLRDPVMRV